MKQSPPSSLPPGVDDLDREVHVWTADLSRLTDAPLFQRWLSPQEEQRCQRYLRQRDRDLFLLAHGLLRHTLSQYADVAPEQWTFSIGEYGRPEIAGPISPGKLRFNLSHTEGLAAVLISDGVDAGVDVEKRSSTADPALLARNVFSPSEIEALWGLEDGLLRRRFYQFWTLKESYIKARGMGLHLPLRQFSFSRSNDHGIQIAFDPRMDDQSGNWQFSLWQPTEDHQGAVAIKRGRGRDRSIVFRQGLVF